MSKQQTKTFAINLFNYQESHAFFGAPLPVESFPSSSASTMSELLDWRVRDRLRTLAAGLVLCLHLGVDPPDVWKPSLCARWECWIDPVNGNPIRKVGNVEETTQDSGDGSTDGSTKPRNCFTYSLLR